jgi:hypothetical protein
MTVRKSPTGIESDDSTLLQYESLRSQVLNRQMDFSKRGLGLTLFIRRGIRSGKSGRTHPSLRMV